MHVCVVFGSCTHKWWWCKRAGGVTRQADDTNLDACNDAWTRLSNHPSHYPAAISDLHHTFLACVCPCLCPPSHPPSLLLFITHHPTPLATHLAMTNSSRTMREPSPMYFCTSSLPLTRMKVQSVWWATARASSVLPVPGGPYSSTPYVHVYISGGRGARAATDKESTGRGRHTPGEVGQFASQQDGLALFNTRLRCHVAACKTPCCRDSPLTAPVCCTPPTHTHAPWAGRYPSSQTAQDASAAAQSPAGQWTHTWHGTAQHDTHSTGVGTEVGTLHKTALSLHTACAQHHTIATLRLTFNSRCRDSNTPHAPHIHSFITPTQHAPCTHTRTPLHTLQHAPP